MKKSIFLLIIVIAITAAVSAQSYTVHEVTGRVQREAGNNRVNVSVGDTITADTVIHTGVGASLVLKSGDDSFTVFAARNGMVSELISSASGVRISGSVIRVDTNAVARTGGHIPTASARASDAAQEDDIASE